MGAQTATVMAMIAVLTAGVAAQEHAAPGPGPTVVLHVTDYAQVSRGDLAEAEQLVTRIYRAAGVRTIWTDGPAATVPAEGAFHVDVILLSREMVGEKCRMDGISDTVFGTATQSTRRAYIFYSRVAGHAARTEAAISRLLAGVLAHEIGHVLLPANGHSASGIMRGTWEGRIVRVPGFTTAQAATIRSLLTVANAN